MRREPAAFRMAEKRDSGSNPIAILFVVLVLIVLGFACLPLFKQGPAVIAQIQQAASSSPRAVSAYDEYMTVFGIGPYGSDIRIRILDNSRLDYEVKSARIAGTYTHEGTALRVVLATPANNDSAEFKQVQYFKRTPEGLVGEYGQILLSMEKLQKLGAEGYLMRDEKQGGFLRFVTDSYRNRTSEVVAGDPPPIRPAAASQMSSPAFAPMPIAPRGGSWSEQTSDSNDSAAADESDKPNTAPAQTESSPESNVPGTNANTDSN